MTEPKPWLETGDASPEVLTLLRSGSPARALDVGGRARSRRRVRALVSVPAAAGVLLWLQHMALGAIVGAIVTTAAVAPRLLGSHAREAPPAPPPAHVRWPMAPAAKVAVPGREAARSDEPKAAVEVPPSAAFRRDEAEPDLAREARLLERARTLLATDPAAALGVLRRHESEAPHGALEIERELLQVDALVRLGRRAEAENRARALRARAPGSLYEGRLARLLGEQR